MLNINAKIIMIILILNTHASRTLDVSPTHILLLGTVHLLEEW